MKTIHTIFTLFGRTYCNTSNYLKNKQNNPCIGDTYNVICIVNTAISFPVLKNSDFKDSDSSLQEWTIAQYKS